jgi:hypothetical protein
MDRCKNEPANALARRGTEVRRDQPYLFIMNGAKERRSNDLNGSIEPISYSARSPSLGSNLETPEGLYRRNRCLTELMMGPKDLFGGAFNGDLVCDLFVICFRQNLLGL